MEKNSNMEKKEISLNSAYSNQSHLLYRLEHKSYKQEGPLLGSKAAYKLLVTVGRFHQKHPHSAQPSVMFTSIGRGNKDLGILKSHLSLGVGESRETPINIRQLASPNKISGSANFHLNVYG